VADLKTKRVETLQLKGLEKLRPRARAARFLGDLIDVPEQAIEPGEATLNLQLELPRGFKLNALAPTAVTVRSADQPERTFRKPQFPLAVPIKLAEGVALISAEFSIYYCESDKETLCFIKEARLKIPVKARPGAGTNKLSATYKLTIGTK
jgi:hypothetical protein